MCDRITDANQTTYGSASESSHSKRAESRSEPADCGFTLNNNKSKKSRE
jgi:hypothetical protein